MLNLSQNYPIYYNNLESPTTLKLCSKVRVQRWSSYLNKISIIFTHKEVCFQQNWRSFFVRLGIRLVILEFRAVEMI